MPKPFLTRPKVALRRQLDAILARLGYKLVKHMPPLRTSVDLAITALANQHRPFVIDVGAADGDFTGQLLAAMPDAEILCIDPLAGHAAALRQRFPIPNVRIEEVALGETESEAIFHETAHPHSSSLLPPSEHMQHFPSASGCTKRTIVSVVRLDQLIEGTGQCQIDLLKVDTQGYELSVLKGATGSLRSCSRIIIEMSLRPLYEGQASFEEVMNFLNQHGFHMTDYAEGARSYTTGEILQLDVLFQRV
jgi:FkbM family methyltransferase